MSVVRFVHTDFLRLGTPITGLADSPSWLNQLATGAVRQAVRNVIDLTVSQKAGFLLIAGSIADTRENLEPAARWLNEQFETLRTRGISIVAVAEDSESHAVLSQCCDFVLRPAESLRVSEGAGGVRIEIVSHPHRNAGELFVNVGGQNLLQHDDFVYQARPSNTATSDLDFTKRDKCISRSAGPVQSTSNAETQSRGCVVVEADFAHQQLRSDFCTCDVIRFRSETVSLSESGSGQTLVTEIVRASDSVDHTTDQTVVVDWLVNSNVTTDLGQVEQLNSDLILSQLREHMHSGHRGIWPRKVTFSDSTLLRLSTPVSAVVEEFADLAAPSIRYHEGNGRKDDQPEVQRRYPARPELLCGLSFLSRVA